MGETFHKWIEEEKPGFYQITFPSISSDEDVAEFCQASVAHWKKVSCPTITLVDCRAVSKAPAVQRRLFAENVEAVKPYALRFQVAVGIVAPNVLVKGLVKAIYWISPPGYSYKVFTDIAEARAWLEAQLEGAE